LPPRGFVDTLRAVGLPLPQVHDQQDKKGGVVTENSKPGGLDANIAGALAYLRITAILFLVIEPFNKDRFVRFHSFQALAFGVASIVIQIVLGFIPIIGWLLMLPVSLVVWLICLFKAFSNQKFKLPVIGNWAEAQANA
jgi:uncharacterized membrane protein